MKRQTILIILLVFVLTGVGSAFYFELFQESSKEEIHLVKEENVDKKIEEEKIIEKEEEVKEEEEEKIETESASVKVSSVEGSLPSQIVKCFNKTKGTSSPKGVSFSPDNKEVWVTSLMNKSSGVFVYDVQTGEIKETIKLPEGGGVEVIFNSDGTRAFVSQMETARVYEIDSKTKEVLRFFDTRNAWTKVMVLSPEEDYLYASNWSGNGVSVIDLSSGLLKETIPTVQTPRGVYATKDGKYLYVAGFSNGEIQKINLTTKESEVIYRNEGAMRHIVGDEERGFLYVSDMANARIYRVTISDNTVEVFAETERNPNTITLSPDKNILAVSCRGVNNPESYYIPGPEWGSVLFFDTESGEMVDALVGGNQTTGLDIANSGNYFVYSDFLDASLTLCNFPSADEFLEGEGGASLEYKTRIKK